MYRISDAIGSRAVLRTSKRDILGTFFFGIDYEKVTRTKRFLEPLYPGNPLFEAMAGILEQHGRNRNSTSPIIQVQLDINPHVFRYEKFRHEDGAHVVKGRPSQYVSFSFEGDRFYRVYAEVLRKAGFEI